MTGRRLINRVVSEEYRDKAHVRALIPEGDSWWHVHRDEALPKGYSLAVYVAIEPLIKDE